MTILGSNSYMGENVNTELNNKTYWGGVMSTRWWSRSFQNLSPHRPSIHAWKYLHKSGPKWIKDLKIRPETVKLLEENTGKMLLDVGLGNEFLYMTPKARAKKAKTDKWNCIKLKSFCTAKETMEKVKRQFTEWKKISVQRTSDNWLISKICKELNSIARKQISWWKNGQRTWIDISQKKTYKWPTGLWKKCSTSPIKEMQLKTTMRYHLTPVRMDIIKKARDNKCWQGCGEKEHCWWECTVTKENNMEFFQKTKQSYHMIQ